MPYVVVVYAGPTSSRAFGTPTGYCHDWFAPATNPLCTDLDVCRDTADAASRSFGRGSHGLSSARYAVHEWLGEASGPAPGAMPAFDLLSAPVYVPPGSEDAAAYFLNAAPRPHTDHMQSLASSVAPGGVIDWEHIAPDRPRSYFQYSPIPAAVAADVAPPSPVPPVANVAATVARYPIDPSLPLELTDGTPCQLITDGQTYEDGSNVPALRVVVLSQPTERYIPNATGGYGWWHAKDDGRFLGDRDFLRLRNVLGASHPEPAATKPSGPTFEVRAGLVGTDRDTWGTIAEGFESGKEAAAYVAERKAEFAAIGKALFVKKREPGAGASVDWRARERKRLEDGTYIPLPGDWAAIIARGYPDHFAHVAASDKRKVAFTESEGSGERDRQKVLSAAEYVRRYFNGSGYDNHFWNAETRSQFMADMCGGSTNVLFSPLGDAEAIERVYRDCGNSRFEGVASCMTHHPDNYANKQIPVRVYALGGDITIAFLRSYAEGNTDADGDSLYGTPSPDAAWDGEGDILARCLVFPANKEYGRVYGERTAARMLRTALEAQGYSEGSLTGARMAKVPLPEHGEFAYQVPYLDIGNSEFGDGGGFWIVGEEGYAGGSTNGVTYAAPMVECDRCSDDVAESNTRTVYVGEDDTEQWCPRCYDYHTSTVHDGSTWVLVNSEDVVEYRRSGAFSTEEVASWMLEANGGDLPGILVADVWEADAFVCSSCDSEFRDRYLGGHDDDGDPHCEDCWADLEQAASEAAEAELAASDPDDTSSEEETPRILAA